MYLYWKEHDPSLLAEGVVYKDEVVAAQSKMEKPAAPLPDTKLDVKQWAARLYTAAAVPLLTHLNEELAMLWAEAKDLWNELGVVWNELENGRVCAIAQMDSTTLGGGYLRTSIGPAVRTISALTVPGLRQGDVVYVDALVHGEADGVPQTLPTEHLAWIEVTDGGGSTDYQVVSCYGAAPATQMLAHPCASDGPVTLRLKAQSPTGMRFMTVLAFRAVAYRKGRPANSLQKGKTT